MTVKIQIDFEVDFEAKIEPKWSPQGAKMGAKSEKNLSKIEVKFEVDFGCDFDAIWATGSGPTTECAEPVKLRSGQFRGTHLARPCPDKSGAADSNAPRIPPGREGRCDSRKKIPKAVS